MEDRGLPTEEAVASTPRAAASAGGEATRALGVPSTPDPQTTAHPDAPKSGPVNTPKSAHSLEDANEELSKLISNGKIKASEVPAVKAMLKEHESLREKVDKLKSLLGRSAKVQRETKVDLDATQKRLSQALREIERMNQKLEKLQSRPTHCK